MAIEDIIAKGIGFSPGSVKFIPTHGFATAAVVAESVVGEKWAGSVRRRTRSRMRSMIWIFALLPWR